MYRIVFFIAYCFLSVHCQAQQAPVLSPLTKKYLNEVKQHPGVLPQGYLYRMGQDNNPLLKALVKVRPGCNAADLESQGIRIGTKAGSVWTIQIPPAKLNSLITNQTLAYIQLDEPVHMAMDSVRKLTRTDSVHAGLGALTSSYHGSGVVVGIIDAGFDYLHPVLFDTSNGAYRVKRVWEQQKSGTQPAGFTYGNELTQPQDIWAAGTDMDISHGTHVAGIAAGSGFGTPNRQFMGNAPAADLVLVGITPSPDNWTSTGMSDIIDGMSYIFAYAASVGKAAVVNLSWGCTIGPHDGLSLFSQACDALTGPGKIFVCSAGNNGSNRIHLDKTFSASDTLLQSFVGFNSNLQQRRTWTDVWGDSSKQFCVQLSLFSGGAKIDSTQFFCLDDQLHQAYLVGSNGDTMFATISTSAVEFNGKPRIFMELYSRVTEPVLMTIKSSGGKVHCWNGFVLNTTGYYADFTNGGYPWATPGNTSSTIGDMASTRSALAVGAYNARISYTNVSGGNQSLLGYAVRGFAAPFSSKGPTADGRIKPDISAPGLVIGSSVSSYDSSFMPSGASYASVVHTYFELQNSRTYPFAMLMGTSMSSPAAAGIVALMLEANPGLSPEEVKLALGQSAIRDNFTGNLPAQGNNTWGAGKINAMGAIAGAIALPVTEFEGAGRMISIYPNPANAEFRIEIPEVKGSANISIYNIAGMKIHEVAATGIGPVTVNVGSWPRGLYYVRVTAPGRSTAGSLLLH
ncbi:MAG: T9SS type A sorting domain-containing protein [Sphingobacteriales bacterium]|nr:MAG: T9SS type A sorting domain-containing protein [Sphingobacteriales bacterium]